MSNHADLEQVVGLIAQSISLQLAQRADDALLCLNQALQLAPDFPAALAKRGTVLQSLSRHREALADFDRCLTVKSDLSHIVVLRDAVLQCLLASLDDDLRQNPLQADKLHERGLLMLRLRRKSEALENFRQVLAIDAYHAGALNSMGNVLLLLNRHEQALACYDKILALNP
ncbi:MAG TPA: tetratricopeptide repeat protein, partial [Burkholderiaceae bacterium]|nr:tetratricopeptide repeat protein [Burkholderiaceae bacterium]